MQRRPCKCAAESVSKTVRSRLRSAVARRRQAEESHLAAMATRISPPKGASWTGGLTGRQYMFREPTSRVSAAATDSHRANPYSSMTSLWIIVNRLNSMGVDDDDDGNKEDDEEHAGDHAQEDPRTLLTGYPNPGSVRVVSVREVALHHLRPGGPFETDAAIVELLDEYPPSLLLLLQYGAKPLGLAERCQFERTILNSQPSARSLSL